MSEAASEYAKEVVTMVAKAKENEDKASSSFDAIAFAELMDDQEIECD